DTLAVTRMKEAVAFLASDSLGGRPSGTILEEHAANWIVEQLNHSGISTSSTPFDVPFSQEILHCKNVIGQINNGADSTIIISAHYDHLGTGSGKSLEIVKKGIHRGADDNASGVALMLELAHWLANDSLAPTNYNYQFVGLSAHEIGLFGSKNYVQSELFLSLNVKLVVNLDMVGRLDHVENKVRMSHCNTTTQLKSMLSSTAISSIKISFDDEHTTINDLTTFCDKNVPAISLTTGIHDDYHRLGDTADKLNYEGMEKVLRLLKSILNSVF
ncbi:MAG: M28 family peptidase, partial [Flavobacteriales bacterium]|nr:M28 family peptidase [Flavobacteriales bacterium]